MMFKDMEDNFLARLVAPGEIYKARRVPEMCSASQVGVFPPLLAFFLGRNGGFPSVLVRNRQEIRQWTRCLRVNPSKPQFDGRK